MNLRRTLWLGTLLLAPALLPLHASDDESEEGADCFYQNQVRHYQVVDEQHITLEVTNNRYYVVELWRAVRNLDRTRAIAFESSTNRVCPRFSVVRVDGGVRIRSIRQITEAERDALLGQGEAVGDSPVDGAEIEDVTGENPAQEQEEDKQ